LRRQQGTYNEAAVGAAGPEFHPIPARFCVVAPPRSTRPCVARPHLVPRGRYVRCLTTHGLATRSSRRQCRRIDMGRHARVCPRRRLDTIERLRWVSSNHNPQTTTHNHNPRISPPSNTSPSQPPRNRSPSAATTWDASHAHSSANPTDDERPNRVPPIHAHSQFVGVALADLPQASWSSVQRPQRHRMRRCAVVWVLH